MVQIREIKVIITGVLLLVTVLMAACTVTDQASEATPTAPPSATIVVTSTPTPEQEIVEQPTVEIVEEPTIAFHDDEIGGYVELVDALRAAGATVEPAGEVDQPFFSVAGQVMTVNGGDVQVFEYPDASAAEAEAALISPDGGSVGTSMMSWIATPHFYTLDRVITLYVGEDAAIIEALNTVLGQPIAEGQVFPLPPPDTAVILSDALEAADYATLEKLMGDPFAIGIWNSEGLMLSQAEAMEQLQLNLLPDPAGVSFIRDRSLFPDLGDIDPTAVFGPEVQIVDLVYSLGWGADGLGETILTIAEDSDGNHYWQGIIYGGGGFAVAPSPEPQSLSFEANSYHNSENGFEFAYPTSWRLDERVLGSRGSGALFYETDEDPVFSAVVYLWSPKNDLDAWLDLQRRSWSGSGATVLSEEELSLAGGHRAVQVELEWPGARTNRLFMRVGENYLELIGRGDKETFDEIVSTLRFVESDS